MKSFITLLVLAVLCGLAASHDYKNPLIPSPTNCPDPGAYLYKDGTYYVATTSNHNSESEGLFPIHASADLVSWKVRALCMLHLLLTS